MQFMCISRRLPESDPERLTTLAIAETRAAWQLYREGLVQALNFDDARGQGLITLHAQDAAEVRARLARLPMVSQGQIDFDIYAMGPYSRLEALFAPELQHA
jgi:hypothetical protein